MDKDKPKSICESKVFYDSEFQAVVVAARRTAEWGQEMEPYQCGRHWHIAHVDRALRGKYRRKEKERP